MSIFWGVEAKKVTWSPQKFFLDRRKKGFPFRHYIGIAALDHAFRFGDDLAALDSFFSTGNTLSVAANRISYVFDLRGPSMAIDTACSSALVAFHQACRAIASGESTLALAGGSNLLFHPFGFVFFARASMLSRQGCCKVFDASADGYVRSEGAGIFILKDYDQAVADGNPVLAIVAHTELNTDGSKTGLTVPSFHAQVALLEKAYARAGIDPAAIDYLEMHGTGTPVGDPIEARAVAEALGKPRSREHPLPIGSVKSNLGHLEPASAVPSLVKALLGIQHRVIPATIGLETPNPHIPFEDWNLTVVRRNLALDPHKTITIGVNSFGFGGANAHAILQSPGPWPLNGCKPPRTGAFGHGMAPLILSAKSAEGLQQLARDYAFRLESRDDLKVCDIAYSAAFHRDRLRQRVLVYGDSRAAVAQSLREFAQHPENELPAVMSLTAPANPRGAVFIYSGNGSQWFQMGRHLLTNAVFRRSIREVDAIFQTCADYRIEPELAGETGEGRFEYTEIAQPSLFALQVGLTNMLRELGLEPVVTAGHSFGEVAAAWAAGILSLPDAVHIVYHRSMNQGITKGQGGMTAVAAGEDLARALLAELDLTGELFVAVINSFRGVTLAGSLPALEKYEAVLRTRHIRHKRLDIDYAFHSPAMDNTREPILKELAAIRPKAGIIPFFSSVTAGRVEGKTLNADYWWRNTRNSVQFAGCMSSLIAEGYNIFVEISPHNILGSYINDALRNAGVEGRVVATLTRHEGQVAQVEKAAGQAIAAGAETDWRQFFPAGSRFVPIPNYPWQRERFQLQGTCESAGLLERQSDHPLLGYPLKQHPLTWENRLDTQTFPFLADHRVEGSTIFPGTGYVELILAAARVWRPKDAPLVFEELDIINPLLLSDQQLKKVRVSICSRNAGITVQSREYAVDTPWTQHAKGRILVESPGMALALPAPSVPGRAPDFMAADHQARTRAAGLDYGPAFCCIDHGWIEGDCVLARLCIPQAVRAGLASMHLHPALLDNTLQLIIHCFRDDPQVHEAALFVPIRFGKVFFNTRAGHPELAQATLLSRAAHSLKAECALFDARGNAVAVLREVRFRGIPLGPEPRTHLNYLKHCSIARPHPDTPAPAPMAAVSLAKLMAEKIRHRFQADIHRRYAEEVEPLLDSLCSRFTIEAFQKIARDESYLPRETVAAARVASPRMAPFWDDLIHRAETDGTLVRHDHGWIMDSRASDASDLNQPPASYIWNILLADYPDYASLITMVGCAGLNLAAILTGDRTLAELLLPHSAPVIPLGQVLGAARRHTLGQVFREVLQEIVTSMPRNQRFSVMEVAAGPPLLIEDICRSLDFDRCDYTFAGISPEVLNDVNRLRALYPAIQSHLIPQDVEPAQPFLKHPAHLIIVTLDFSTVSQSIQVLQGAKASLADGGSLWLAGLHGARWLDTAFGSLADWFEDTRAGVLSTSRALLFWQRQLTGLGLTGGPPIELVPETRSDFFLLPAWSEPTRPMPPEQHCETDREAQRIWILLADDGTGTLTLADALQARLLADGDRVLRASIRNAEEAVQLLNNAASEFGRVDGILHLAGLTLSCHTGGASDEEVMNRQIRRCTVAACMARACEETEASVPVWMVTAGATRHQIASHETGPPGPGPPSDATSDPLSANGVPEDSVLWGFARTMMNESPHYTVRAIDIELPVNGEEALVTALLREFRHPDGESEVILTGTGDRFVPRLRLEAIELTRDQVLPGTRPPFPIPSQAPHNRLSIPNDTKLMRLGFQFPGQLSNLRWEALPDAGIEDDEVEVQVHATGLNFRDVMYTLGLLSDEAVENGFAGATLGLEFAGTVRRTGTNSEGFAVGDRVMGFGSGCFANRVITKTHAIGPIPSDMSFEAAATVPVAFLTAYYALKHLAQLQPQEKILIHGAAGGLGMAAIQVANVMGAEIHATAGTDTKRDVLRLLGVRHIYHSRSLAFAEEVLAQTGGKGVDVVLNSLAGEAVNRNLQVLKPFGRFLELGKRDFYENTAIGLRPFRNNVSYFGIDADQLITQRPTLNATLFGEVMALFAANKLYPLPYHEFDASHVTDAFRYMQQARHTGKIVVTYRNGIESRQTPGGFTRPLPLSAEGTWLVTGGLAGFGLRTAQWLAEKGVRQLVLISRTGPAGSECRAALQALEARGVNVWAAACDVTSRPDLEKLMAAIRATRPPLRGIVHAAAVIEDGLVIDLDEDHLRRVLAPKILGARALHELTLGQPLEAFILYASGSTMFGAPGQACYVGANAWLEALAHYRRERGLPATCISWGAIGDVGFLTRHRKVGDALQNHWGVNPMTSASALNILEDLLAADRSGLAVMDLDWHVIFRTLPGARTPRYSDVREHYPETGGGDEGFTKIDALLDQLSDAELVDLIVEILKAEIGEILRIPPTRIDPLTSVYDLGLDSLMGVELVAALETRFNVRLSVITLRDNATITKLAHTILRRIKGPEPLQDAAESASARHQVQDLADRHGVETTSREVTELVSSLEKAILEKATGVRPPGKSIIR